MIIGSILHPSRSGGEIKSWEFTTIQETVLFERNECYFIRELTENEILSFKKNFEFHFDWSTIEKYSLIGVNSCPGWPTLNEDHYCFVQIDFKGSPTKFKGE